MSWLFTPPVPSDCGGGPRQLDRRRFARDSEKAPQVLHHTTVPDLRRMCSLPAASSIIFVQAFSTLPPHFLDVSLHLLTDLVLQVVQTHPLPVAALTTERPPLLGSMISLFSLGALFLLPSFPSLVFAFDLFAASALHLDDSESLKGKAFASFAAFVAIPIHLALAPVSSMHLLQALTSALATLWNSTARFASTSASSLALRSFSVTRLPSLFLAIFRANKVNHSL